VEIVLSEMCSVGTVNCFYPKSKVINIQHAWRCGSTGLGKGELGEKINSSIQISDEQQLIVSRILMSLLLP